VHSRFTASPRGTVIAWRLSIEDLLKVESPKVVGVIAVEALDDLAPWVTAHQVELLGGQPIASVPEASAAIKSLVQGIGGHLAVKNRGLLGRERDRAVEALTYFRDHGHQLDPPQLIVEAIRDGWPRTSPLELASLAERLNAGTRLHYKRGQIREETLAEWVGRR
jgi:hypothetical protein